MRSLLFRRALPLLLVPLLPQHRALAQDAIREEVVEKKPELTRPPKLITFVPAAYPSEARDRGIQGSVTMWVDLDDSGTVSRVEVISSPDPSLSAAAEAAVKQFRFRPAELDGKPAPIRVQYTYNFVLEIAFSPRPPRWMEERQGVPESQEPLVGRVREQGTRLPVPGASVAIMDLGIEVKADDKGYFRFADVPPGRYKVKAIATEYRRETIEVEIKEGEQSIITFYLPRLTVDPYETVVRGQRRKTVVTRVTLRQKELTTVPGTFGDPVRVIENLPGVARIPLVGGALLIRGAAPSDSGVYLDGTEIPQIYHFLGGPSVLNPQFLDRIDYYPGNADVRYGRLLAGVVDVHTANTFTEQWGGSLDVNLLNTAAFLKAPVTKNVSVAGAVRRSYIDAILPSLLDASGQEATTVVPVYYDYQLRVDVKLPGDNQLFVLGFGSDDQLEIVSNEQDEDLSVDLDSHITFHRVLSGWRWQINDRLVSRMTPAFGFDYINFSLGEAGVTLRQIDLTLREDLEYKLSRRLTLRFGLDTKTQQVEFDAEVPIPADYRNPGSGRTTLFTDEPQKVTLTDWFFGLGAYLDIIANLSDRLQLIPGVRLELHRYFFNNRMSAEPRLTSRFKLLDKTTLKAAAGLYAKPPDPGQVNKQFGNNNLTLEQAAHFSLGVEQQLFDALGLDAQVYYLRRFNLGVRTDALRPGPDVSPLRYVSRGSAYSTGLELILKHDVTDRLYGWLAYTLSLSKAQQEAGGPFVNAVFDQTHILTLVASVKLGWGMEVGTRFRLVSGRPDNEVLGGIYDSDRNRYWQIIDELRGIRQPTFHQLDLRVEKTWFFDLWRLSAYLDVQNVYNATNAEATLYDYRFAESGPLPGLPILPTFGIKGSF